MSQQVAERGSREGAGGGRGVGGALQLAEDRWAGKGGRRGPTALRTQRPERAASADPGARTALRRGREAACMCHRKNKVRASRQILDVNQQTDPCKLGQRAARHAKLKRPHGGPTF